MLDLQETPENILFCTTKSAISAQLVALQSTATKPTTSSSQNS